MGDDEKIEVEDEWEMPESPCTIKIVAFNEDDTYPHGFFVRIATRKKKEKIAGITIAEGGIIEIEVPKARRSKRLS
jgi:hypothetical protein